MQRLTIQECRKLRLPERSPIPPFEAVDWYELVPQADHKAPAGDHRKHLAEAANILGGNREAAA